MKLKPVRRTDEHHIEKHKSFLSLPNKQLYRVVFLGDSLTRRWEDNPGLWEEYFQEFSPINLGVGADCVENLLWRVRNGEIDGFAAPLFLILIGTNNITQHKPDEIVEGILEIVDTVRTGHPKSKIVVFGLLPRGVDQDGQNSLEEIDRVNTLLTTAALDHQYTYEYFGNLLLSPDKSINRGIMPDGLHLNESGYRVVGPVIRRIIAKHCGA